MRNDDLFTDEEKRMLPGRSSEILDRITEPGRSSTQFMGAAEVAAACGVSLSKAYGIIRQMNSELKAGGFLTLAGKVPRKYFDRKVYGMGEI